jgi:hypothetical protein
MASMSTLIQPLFVIVLFVAVHSGVLAVTSGNTIRSVLYGFVAVLALIVVVLNLLGIH